MERLIQLMQAPPDYTETKAGPDRANEVYRPVRPTLVSLSWQVV